MMTFLAQDSTLTNYMAFPRFLMDAPVNETAKLLYMLLLDRARMSQTHEGWTDEEGRVFVRFTIKDLAAALHRSEMTVKTALSELEKQDMILRQRQGACRPNLIYVKIPGVTERKLSYGQTENCPMDGKKSVPGTDSNLFPNKYRNKTKSKTGSNGFGRYGNPPPCRSYEYKEGESL